MGFIRMLLCFSFLSLPTYGNGPQLPFSFLSGPLPRVDAPVLTERVRLDNAITILDIPMDESSAHLWLPPELHGVIIHPGDDKGEPLKEMLGEFLEKAESGRLDHFDSLELKPLSGGWGYLSVASEASSLSCSVRLHWDYEPVVVTVDWCQHNKRRVLTAFFYRE